MKLAKKLARAFAPTDAPAKFWTEADDDLPAALAEFGDDAAEMLDPELRQPRNPGRAALPFVVL